MDKYCLSADVSCMVPRVTAKERSMCIYLHQSSYSTGNITPSCGSDQGLA